MSIAMTTSGIGANRLDLEFCEYQGGRYIQAGITLHYIPNAIFSYHSEVIWLDIDNYDSAVQKGIQEVINETNFVGEFILEKVKLHEVNSSFQAFYRVAREATFSIVRMSK